MNWKYIKKEYPSAYSEFIGWIVCNTTLIDYLDFNENIEEIPYEMYLGSLMIFFDELGIKIHCNNHDYSFYITIMGSETEKYIQHGSLKECYDRAFDIAFYILDNSKKIEL